MALPISEPITATLTVAGDAMSHMPQTNDAYVAETGEYDYSPMLRYAKPWVEQADLAIANLETTFYGGPNYSGYPAFNLSLIHIFSHVHEHQRGQRR